MISVHLLLDCLCFTVSRMPTYNACAMGKSWAQRVLNPGEAPVFIFRALHSYTSREQDSREICCHWHQYMCGLLL